MCRSVKALIGTPADVMDVVLMGRYRKNNLFRH